MISGRRRRTALPLALLLAVMLASAGCSAPEPTPGPSTPSSSTRPFTVMTTDRIVTADPAAVTDQGSMIVVQNVFQRLLTSEPGDSEVAPGIYAYKPDLARDCSFTATLVYTCTLNPKATFSNDKPVTAADVKFSVERAIRLDVPGTSVPTFDSLRTIETPDAVTVRFLLSRPDRQFGWALASPAASIVDRSSYDPDEIQRDDRPVVGSGPYQVDTLTDDTLELSRREDYLGRTRGILPRLQILTHRDPVDIEQAMTNHQVDLVWRGLTAAAVSRVGNQIEASPDRTSAAGFTERSLAGTRVLQLRWNPASRHRSDATLRRVLNLALQSDRTLDSIVPPQVPGHRSTFRLGGAAAPVAGSVNRVSLTLGYDATEPDGREIANQLRTRLEDTGGISVRLRTDDPDTDLLLEDRKAWTPTALAWLQPYLDDPLPADRRAARTIAAQARTAATPAALSSALNALQVQSGGADLVLPLTQSDEQIYLAPGVDISDTSFGPGWQFGVWGISVR